MRCVTLLMLLCWALSAAASQEGILAFRKFRLESAGLGSSGPVVVSGTQSDAGIESIRVTAFGKSYSPARAQIEQLRGVAANGIQLSYEGGYPELGGRTVYIIFSRGFTSGSEGLRYVSIAERGDIEVKNVSGR